MPSFCRRAEASVYRRASEKLAFGVIALDETGGLIGADETARGWLAGPNGISVKGGRLHARHDNGRLRGAIREALELDTTKFMHVGDADGLDLLLVPAARSPDLGATSPRLLVYVSSRSGVQRDTSAELAELFNLTAAQARLAMLLANGQTLAQAACMMGVTELTARTYSKQIFDRTGTHRQSEVVKRILTSVAMLGNPGPRAIAPSGRAPRSERLH